MNHLIYKGKRQSMKNRKCVKDEVKIRKGEINRGEIRARKLNREQQLDLILTTEN